ncbi:MAG: hypothetical protein HQK54_14550, partial [Oligoflexales bacterium]|nr:hypothetical protein [Oligoflexales bacterium]
MKHIRNGRIHLILGAIIGIMSAVLVIGAGIKNFNIKLLSEYELKIKDDYRLISALDSLNSNLATAIISRNG